MKQHTWISLEELLQKLNRECNYLILRNFEEICEKNFLTEDHPDMDLLCDNPCKLKKLLQPVNNPGHVQHKDHYWIKIGQRMMEVGIRSVDDLYYDAAWAKNMLASRILHQGGFYTMNQENYFYSLTYHAFFQKKNISEDYRIRLIKLASILDIPITEESQLIPELLQYMKKKGYFVTYPKDITIPIQFHQIPAEMLHGKLAWKIRRILLIPERITRFILRRILKP